MKTNSKLALCLLALVIIVTASCKQKPGDSAVAAMKRAAVIDSLKIADSQEISVCTEFDEDITDYISKIEAVAADTTKFKSPSDSPEAKAIEKEFEVKTKKLEPEMKSIKKKIEANPVEQKKFEDFTAYEIKRLFAVLVKYQKLGKHV